MPHRACHAEPNGAGHEPDPTTPSAACRAHPTRRVPAAPELAAPCLPCPSRPDAARPNPAFLGGPASPDHPLPIPTMRLPAPPRHRATNDARPGLQCGAGPRLPHLSSPRERDRPRLNRTHLACRARTRTSPYKPHLTATSHACLAKTTAEHHRSRRSLAVHACRDWRGRAIDTYLTEPAKPSEAAQVARLRAEPCQCPACQDAPLHAARGTA